MRAKQATSALVFGRDVMLDTHGQDKYGRTLADVLLPDGTNKSYRMRRDHVRNLVQFFKSKPLGAITPEDVRKYRQQRVGPKGRAVAIQTINHDHTALIHMLNVARSPQFGLIKDNPAVHVPKPNPQNERERIANGDEWKRLLGEAAPHLQKILTILYILGPRRGELLSLE